MWTVYKSYLSAGNYRHAKDGGQTQKMRRLEKLGEAEHKPWQSIEQCLCSLMSNRTWGWHTRAHTQRAALFHTKMPLSRIMGSLRQGSIWSWLVCCVLFCTGRGEGSSAMYSMTVRNDHSHTTCTELSPKAACSNKNNNNATSSDLRGPSTWALKHPCLHK